MEDMVINSYMNHQETSQDRKRITKKVLGPIRNNKSYRELIKHKNYSKFSLPDETMENDSTNNSFQRYSPRGEVDVEMDKQEKYTIKRNLISRFRRSPYVKNY